MDFAIRKVGSASSSAKREKKRPNKIRTTTGDKENKSTIKKPVNIIRIDTTDV